MGALARHRVAWMSLAALSIWGSSCARVPVVLQATPHQVTDAGSRDRMVGDQIPSRGSIEDVLRALRPEFLLSRAGSRGAANAQPPVAYLDGVLLDDLSMLRQIPAVTIAEILFLRSTQASVRFRRHHPGGAIVMVSRTHQ